jgi:hypothetical protein
MLIKCFNLLTWAPYFESQYCQPCSLSPLPKIQCYQPLDYQQLHTVVVLKVSNRMWWGKQSTCSTQFPSKLQ